jgi:mRNA-degrading endonuclease RelE of RelBE toxin-antitoxin system
MQFRIADTFTDSLGRLTGDEQKAVKTTAFDLQVNPSNPGLSYHRLDRAKDKNFWSVRASRDIRIIIHRGDASLLLCYVGHHDDAYQWAERRKLETHPTTGAAQFVEIRERVQEVVIPRAVEAQAPAPSANATKPPLFTNRSEQELLSYGVPQEWLADVQAVDEDGLLSLAVHLPAEAAEALLELAVGGTPVVSRPAGGGDPFNHPDAQRRFRVVKDVEALEQALAFPWEKWTIFLHPQQQQWVERDYNGPARVSGSAGTGKTIVALHRAVHLARTNPGSRVLLTTFSETLANALRTKLRRLTGNQPRLGERIDVYALDAVGLRLVRQHIGDIQRADPKSLRAYLEEAAGAVAPGKFGLNFLLAEWTELVDAWQLNSWEDYRDVRRLGRKTRLSEAQRSQLWAIFKRLRERLGRESRTTMAAMFTQLAQHFAGSAHPPYDFAVVDEAQDINVAQLRFLAALAGGKPNGLFFAGDLGQRIFQQPFSWKSLGVDIRGRSRTLHVNYRTSHQIRSQADRLLGPEVADVDGNIEVRRGTISVFNGPVPLIQSFGSENDEVGAVADWIKARIAEGYAAHEIGIFVRSDSELDRAKAAALASGLAFKILDDGVETTSGHASVCTMHLAKGLEFRAVAVMACDDEVIPLQARVEEAADESDLEEVYNTERHLLYVACTRARDNLHISAVSPASEFLDDLML